MMLNLTLKEPCFKHLQDFIKMSVCDVATQCHNGKEIIYCILFIVYTNLRWKMSEW